jgi:hypothetical protein
MNGLKNKIILMKKIFTLIALMTAVLSTNAQISSFPANEGFEAAFTAGLNVQFIPNWTGSEVATTNRIFANTAFPRTGLQALAAIPTSAFTADIKASLNLTGQSNMVMSFYAKSEPNGGPTSTREAVVYASTSIDGGVTFGPATQIGDTSSFPNASTTYALYTYPLQSNSNNQSNVVVKLSVTRGNGTAGGSAAIFLMDDVNFAASATDVFPPSVASATATSLSSIVVQFSEAVGTSGETIGNYIGIPSIVSAVRNGTNDQVTLNLSSPLLEGVNYTLTVSNVADIAGNVLPAPATFPILFNDNVGNVKITEIMYNDPSAGIDSLEFFEIKNMTGASIAVGGWRVTTGASITFPSGLVLGVNEYKVFSRFPSVVDAFYGITSIGWDANQALTNSGETIALYNAQGTLIDSVAYGVTAPWDSIPNGGGPSLTLCDENSDNDQPGSWTASLDLAGNYIGVPIYGTPGGPCITVGLFEQEKAMLQLAAYPNPVTNVLNVGLNSKMNGNYVVSILDVTGKVVLQQTNVSNNIQNKTSINVAGLTAGVYLISVNQAGNVGQIRFVKQ